jgi:hypothetical protein
VYCSLAFTQSGRGYCHQGLTATYNKLKVPDCQDAPIVELRKLHEEMDRAVLAAYGWSDIPVPPYCPATDADRAAVARFEDAVIDRLFALNAERAAAEAAESPPPPPKKKATRKKKATTQRSLLDHDD